MSILLLGVIYIAFIGLGIPDAVFGSVWPAIHTDFGVDVSMATAVTMTTTIGSMLMSLVSARIIKRLGTARVTAICTVLTASALYGFSVSDGIVKMMLLALPLGLGGGCIDAALNNYVAVNYRASHMSFLHCFYGVGVAASPYIMSLALGSSTDWRQGYRTVFFVQASIALVAILSLPLWRLAGGKEASEAKRSETSTSPFILLKQKRMLLCCAVFTSSCAIEMACCAYGSSFLVFARGLSEADAAMMISVCYAGLASGRLCSGFLSRRLQPDGIVLLGMSILCLGLLLLLIPGGGLLAGIAMFLIGFGNGPIFPNMVHLTPKRFEDSQAAMGVEMTAGYAGVLGSPIICGIIARFVGVENIVWYLLVLFALLVTSILLLRRDESQASQKNLKKL